MRKKTASYPKNNMPLNQALGKKFGSLDSLAFLCQPIHEKQTSEFKPALYCLKIDHVLHPERYGAVG